MDFGIGEMDIETLKLTLNHGTLKLVLITNVAWNISEIQTKFRHQPKASFPIFKIYKIFSCHVIFTDFCSTKLLLLRSPILNISNASFSSTLNRLIVLSACHKLELIGNAQNLSAAFI